MAHRCPRHSIAGWRDCGVPCASTAARACVLLLLDPRPSSAHPCHRLFAGATGDHDTRGGDQSPGNRIGLGLRQHLLRALDALAEAALELCILLPGLDVLCDRGTHDLGNRHGVHASNRFQLLGLLLREADGHGFRGLHDHQYYIAVTRLQ